MPRPKDPTRVRFGSGSTYEVDPDWSYYGSLIFDSATGMDVGWINARSQTGWQVFHRNNHLLGAVLVTGEISDYKGGLVGRVANANADEQVLTGVGTLLERTVAHFQ